MRTCRRDYPRWRFGLGCPSLALRARFGPPLALRARLLAALGAAFVLCTLSALAGQHPRLLISREDVPRLRHACGVGVAGEGRDTRGRAGQHAGEFQALRAHFAEAAETDLLAGELSAAALLHLVDPSDPLDGRRIGQINRALRQPVWFGADTLEALVALDWCWTALEPDARREFMLALRKRAVPFTPAESPLDHRAFAEKLVALAAALVIDEEDEPNPTWAEARRKILAAGREYFERTFPTFVSWRGHAPTSPSVGPWEERDAALAVELAGQLLGRDLWPEYRDTVGRWLEHYVFASFSHPALQHNFIRDDGNLAPLSPVPVWDELLPLTAHLIAARTQDPAAAFVARRIEQQVRGPAADPLAAPWLWVPIVFDTTPLRRCDFARLPAARNFGGAVVFRSRAAASETGIWIEAGQPFLRRRQHFDAGHFLIYDGGELVVAGGDDVLDEAVPSKGGRQRLGQKDEPFDFEQYFTATIAHNCLLLWDPVRVPRWYGQRYEPTGGQRLIEGTCDDFTGSLDGHTRQTARQLAYGQSGRAAYLALDLLPAYEPRAATAHTREFVLVGPGVLAVIDRVTVGRGRAEPIWVVNVPARPTVDGQELAKRAQIEGRDRQAGVWRYETARSLRWCNGDACLSLFPLLPEARRIFLAGGPARRLLVSEGTHTGRTYVGGDADGYEHLVRPAGRARPQNAWYRLATPTVLGPVFGTTPHWGRVEIEATQKAESYLFVNVLVSEAADAARQPTATSTRSDGKIVVRVETGTETALLEVPEDTTGGAVRFEGRETARWTLPTKVEQDEPLPTE